jgi:flagellar motor switch protein FliG
MDTLRQIWERIRNAFTNLDPRRRAAFIAFVVVAVIVIVLGNFAFQNSRYQTLSSGLTLEEASAANNTLISNGFITKLEDGGTTILVEKSSYENARLALAQAGTLPDMSDYYKTYSESLSIGMTKQQQDALYKWVVEKQARDNIEFLTVVDKALVQINLVENPIWVGQEGESSASVVVSLNSTGNLTDEQIMGMQAIVANAIPNLSSENVSITDANGNLLTLISDRDYSSLDAYYDLDYQLAFTQMYETKLQAKVMNMLNIIYGPEDYTLAINAEIDFASRNITVVDYGTEGVLRSEEVTFDRTGSGENIDTPVGEGTEPIGVDDVNPGDFLNTVRNYEIDETTTQTVYIPGEIEWLSVSAVFNQTLTEEEQAQISGIIRAAVGMTREADLLNVTGVTFVDIPDDTTLLPDAPEVYIDAFPWLNSDSVLYFATGAAGVVVLFFLLFFLLGGRRKKVVIPPHEQIVAEQDIEIDENGRIVPKTDVQPESLTSEIDVDGKEAIERLNISTINVNKFKGDEIYERLTSADNANDVLEEYIALVKTIFATDIDLATDIIRLMMYEDMIKETGYAKAAEVLIIVGPEHSSSCLKKMNDDEMIRLVQEITHTQKVSGEDMLNNLVEFTRLFDANRYIKQGGVDYARKLLVMTMGESSAEKLIEKIAKSQNTRVRVPFKSIRKMDPELIISILINEHPQTIALIMAYLDTQKAAQVLTSLPEELQIEVSRRISVMKTAPANVIEQIEGVVNERIASISNSKFTDVGGITTIVDILNAVDRTNQKNILSGLGLESPELAQEIRDGLFVFDDVVKLSDPDIQRVLRDVEQKNLAVALKGVSDELKNRITNNISKRARELLEEEMEYLGPLRLSEIEEAQMTIVATIRDLDEAGEISISSDGEEDAIVY